MSGTAHLLKAGGPFFVAKYEDGKKMNVYKSMGLKLAAFTSVRVRYNYKCSMDTISFNLSLTFMRSVATPGAFLIYKGGFFDYVILL